MKYPLLYFGIASTLAALLVGPSCQPDPLPTDPVAVGIEGLFRAYRDAPDMADKAWTGRTVRVILRPKDYQLGRKTILWFDRFPANQPAAIFETDTDLLDATRRIELVGVCRGRVERPDGEFHVSITACRLRVLP
jgi:hypothetical protein